MRLLVPLLHSNIWFTLVGISNTCPQCAVWEFGVWFYPDSEGLTLEMAAGPERGKRYRRSYCLKLSCPTLLWILHRYRARLCCDSWSSWSSSLCPADPSPFPRLPQAWKPAGPGSGGWKWGQTIGRMEGESIKYTLFFFLWQSVLLLALEMNWELTQPVLELSICCCLPFCCLVD